MNSANKYKKIAKNSFLKRDYTYALLNYSFALKESNEDGEAKLGAILSEMALDQEEEAVALFDFYEVQKSEVGQNAEKKIEEILSSVDEGFEHLNTIFNQNIDEMMDESDTINYDDFLCHISVRGSFKEAFEDIMFSSKVLINEKENLLDFIDKLIQNDFKEIAFNYIEGAADLFPDDEKFKELLYEISKDAIEN